MTRPRHQLNLLLGGVAVDLPKAQKPLLDTQNKTEVPCVKQESNGSAATLGKLTLLLDRAASELSEAKEVPQQKTGGPWIKQERRGATTSLETFGIR
ncbi:hypothetical protein JRQ81_012162 [Phrynocephalus forsythii]|uniref:Uncharacterized protein n=1 Tax=Phrynocephalus forsythii TaxID=171643 RepID=A0A9Q1APT2_9SAUR|nr:hypothetical protein JRQ81_012162 [Phrynocephalus forsythii]